MFLGEYEHTLDDKGRLAIPARFRDELSEGVVITRGFDRCLMGFPVQTWEALAAQAGSLPLGPGNNRNLQRLLFSGASDMTLDRQGRILIPQNLRDYANLGEQVVITGMHKYFEIWSRERWAEVLESLDVNAGLFAEQMAALSL
jgi:MraZ protein